MIKSIAHRTGFITLGVSAVSTLIPVDATFMGLVQATMNFGGGDYFYLTIEEDNKIEDVKVTNVSGASLVVTRAQGGTTAQTFSLAAKYDTAMNQAVVEDIAAGLAPVSTVSITGTGIATVTSDGMGGFNIFVPQPVLTGLSGIEAVTAFPNYDIGLTNNGNCCDPNTNGGGGGTVNIAGAGIVSAALTIGTWIITVPPPTFSVFGGSMTGSWPNYTLTIDAAAGGTVTGITAGAGLVLTGNPNVDPTIAIGNTGVTAAAYGDITFNARGQATVIAGGFNPVSAIVAGSGILVSRAGSTVTVAAMTGAEGVVGGLALADSTAPLDVTDATTAVSPKLLGSVIAGLVSTTLYGGQSYSGEADGDYTTNAFATPTSFILSSTGKALVICNITVRDNAAITVEQAYGIAAFSGGGTRLQANKIVSQCNQSMSFLLSGTYNDSVVLKMTAMPAGASLISASVVVVKI